MPRSDPKIPAVNRSRDRRLDKYIYVSDVELAEQGVDKTPFDLVGRYILYNGVRTLVVGASNGGIIFGQSAVVTDAMFYRFVQGVPTFNCPCGKHTVNPHDYAFCTQGLGRLYYDLEDPATVDWFERNGRQHILIGRERQ